MLALAADRRCCCWGFLSGRMASLYGNYRPKQSVHSYQYISCHKHRMCWTSKHERVGFHYRATRGITISPSLLLHCLVWHRTWLCECILVWTATSPMRLFGVGCQKPGDHYVPYPNEFQYDTAACPTNNSSKWETRYFNTIHWLVEDELLYQHIIASLPSKGKRQTEFCWIHFVIVTPSSRLKCQNGIFLIRFCVLQQQKMCGNRWYSFHVSIAFVDISQNRVHPQPRRTWILWNGKQ